MVVVSSDGIERANGGHLARVIQQSIQICRGVSASVGAEFEGDNRLVVVTLDPNEIGGRSRGEDGHCLSSYSFAPYAEGLAAIRAYLGSDAFVGLSAPVVGEGKKALVVGRISVFLKVPERELRAMGVGDFLRRALLPAGEES